MLVTERWFAREDRWREDLASLVDVYRRRRDVMLAALDKHFPVDATWTHPAGGFYVWATVPSYFDKRALLAAAVERRVAYVPGTAFYPDGRGTDKMRLAFCYPIEQDIVEGVRRLGLLLGEEEELYRSPPEKGFIAMTPIFFLIALGIIFSRAADSRKLEAEHDGLKEAIFEYAV